MKFKLNLTVQALNPGEFEMDEDKLSIATDDSRWQLGDITINGTTMKGRRRNILGKYEYRIGEQEVTPDFFMVTEFLDWRDG